MTGDGHRLGDRAEQIGFELDKCALYPRDAWTFISDACDALNRLCRNHNTTERLTPQQSERLRQSIVAAHRVMDRNASFDARIILARGLKAALLLASCLGEPDNQRAPGHDEAKLDALDQVRILANTAWSVCLAQDIQHRAKKRQTATVSRIIDGALEHLPQFRSGEAA